MSLYDELVAVYPELTIDHFGDGGFILLQNDSDGAGDYIAKWDYEKPIPKGFKLGK
jgi:hypothetical protein